MARLLKKTHSVQPSPEAQPRAVHWASRPVQLPIRKLIDLDQFLLLSLVVRWRKMNGLSPGAALKLPCDLREASPQPGALLWNLFNATVLLRKSIINGERRRGCESKTDRG